MIEKKLILRDVHKKGFSLFLGCAMRIFDKFYYEQKLFFC